MGNAIVVYCLNRMASRCCREGPGVGWRGGMFLCALQHVRCVPPKHVPFSARRSYCSQSNRRVLGANFLRGSAWTYGHGLQGVGMVACQRRWEAQVGPHAPWKFVRNPNEPRKSCSERWVGWWGEVCIHGLQRIPLPLPIRFTARLLQPSATAIGQASS